MPENLRLLPPNPAYQVSQEAKAQAQRQSEALRADVEAANEVLDRFNVFNTLDHVRGKKWQERYGYIERYVANDIEPRFPLFNPNQDSGLELLAGVALWSAPYPIFKLNIHEDGWSQVHFCEAQSSLVVTVGKDTARKDDPFVLFVGESGLMDIASLQRDNQLLTGDDESQSLQDFLQKNGIDALYDIYEKTALPPKVYDPIQAGRPTGEFTATVVNAVNDRKAHHALPWQIRRYMTELVGQFPKHPRGILNGHDVAVWDRQLRGVSRLSGAIERFLEESSRF